MRFHIISKKVVTFFKNVVMLWRGEGDFSINLEEIISLEVYQNCNLLCDASLMRSLKMC